MKAGTYFLNAETEHSLHVHRAGDDEGVVYPDAAERGDADGPRGQRGQDRHPRHRHTLEQERGNSCG